MNGLGARPIDSDLKWYQFSRIEKVVLIELLTNSNVGSHYYLEEISWSLCLVGFIGILVFFKFEKVQ